MMTPSLWAKKVKFFGKDVEIMPLKDIKPGMIGYGKTVFKERLIEEFLVRVVSITEEANNTHLIWIRPTGSPKDILRRAGIIAGMSGSPIYLLLEDEETGQEKIAGALAYGFSFQPFEEALAGITPIEEMLRLEELAKIYEQNEDLAQEIKKASTTYLNKLRIPIVLSGFDSRVVEIFKEELAKRTGLKEENFNFIELSAGSGSNSTNSDAKTDTDALPLKNGDAVAGVLARGAFGLAGIGTVTLSNEIAFVAFGHPFFWTGKTNIPVFGAEIAMIVPTMVSSFKYRKGIVGPQLGTIEVDSLGGILGKWHPGKNTMLPTKLTLTKSYLCGAEKQEEFNTDIAPKAPDSDIVFFVVVLNSIFVGAPDLDNVSVEVETKYTYLDENKTEQELILAKKFFAKDWMDVFLGLMGLWDQYKMFAEAKIELAKIDIDVKVTQEMAKTPTLYLSKIEVAKKQVKPDEKIMLGLMLSDKKKYYSKALEVQAPNFQGEVKIRIHDKESRLKYLINEALREPSKIKRVLEFAKVSASKEGLLYVEIQHIKLIAEREGINNKGWKETIKKIDELVNTELKEVELPEIAGKFNLNISAQLTIRVRSWDVKDDIREAAEEIVEETRNNDTNNTDSTKKDTIKFKPGLFVDPPLGLFSDLHGKLRMNLLGLDVSLIKYKKLQIFNFGLGVNSRINDLGLELYGKFAPIKYNFWKNLYAEANVAVNIKGKVLFGLGISLKLK